MSEAPLRILIVDDDRNLAKSLSAMLASVGAYETRLIFCAADAVPAAIEHAPSIVFLDIELPDMSGYDVAKLLHQHAHLQATRLIALTDNIEHPGREDARAAGFERYLVKPVTLGELQKVLRRRVSIGTGTGGVTKGEGRDAIYRGLP
jgi:CheY-like chemotaxis protein